VDINGDLLTFGVEVVAFAADVPNLKH
jgi:hypothetical protein